MEQSQEKSPAKPEAAPQQRYANLCAMIGERQFTIIRLKAEIQALSQEIAKLETQGAKETPESQG